MNANTSTKPDTRNAILDAARHYMQTSSYDGFSFRDIAQAVGIRKASVYHHFESKEALALAMLERAREWIQHWAQQQSARPPAARLQAYWLEMYRDELGGGTKMCPGGALICGWAHITHAMRQSVRAVFDDQMEFVASAIADGYADGTLRRLSFCDEREAALWFITNLQGALMVSRGLEGQTDMFTRMCDTTMAVLEVRD